MVDSNTCVGNKLPVKNYPAGCNKITHVSITLILGLVLAIVSVACLAETQTSMSQETLCGSISYMDALAEYDGGSETVAHFPPRIPEQATQVNCQYERRFLQGGSSFSVSYKLSINELIVLQEQYRLVAKSVDDSPTFRFPNSFEVYYLNDPDASDWNGYSYGVAISIELQEVIFWVEDVRT